MNYYKSVCIYIIVLGLMIAQRASASCDPLLHFEEAATRMEAYSPMLQRVMDEIESVRGLEWQASLYPNPEFGYSVENIWGNKNWGGWQSAESRYAIAQLIELGGKRSLRYRAANFQYYAAQAGYEVARQILLNKLYKAFAAVAFAQEILKVAIEQHEMGEEIYESVVAKVEAGKASILQQHKAEIALSTAKIHLEKAQIDFMQKKQNLAMLWGSPCVDFDGVFFPFFDLEAPPCCQTCLSNLASHPELVRSWLEYSAAQQIGYLAEAEAIPDVIVAVGCKTIQDTGHKGALLGVTVPIPIFNRNQGNIYKAKAEESRQSHRYCEIEVILRNKLSTAHSELTRAYKEAEVIKTTLLTTAHRTFDLSWEGYHEGKFEYIDVLEAHQILFEILERYAQALLAYHQSKADIDYLNGDD